MNQWSPSRYHGLVDFKVMTNGAKPTWKNEVFLVKTQLKNDLL